LDAGDDGGLDGGEELAVEDGELFRADLVFELFDELVNV
jgi:hypothetical protein